MIHDHTSGERLGVSPPCNLAQYTAQNQPPRISVRFSSSAANRELALSG